MANPEHVAVVRKGAEAIAAWRKQHPQVMLDLSDADLSGANLLGADLSGAKLTGANLFVAQLSHANLAHANLARAHLSHANLPRANLSGTNLYDADLVVANLFNANLSGTNLSKVRFASTTVGDCDLSGCKGLETAVHLFPSSVGLDTLAKTWRGAGNRWIPDLLVFFTGAGVPETLLEYLPSLIEANPLQFYSCFISFGWGDEDKKFADRLYVDLTKRDVKCWKYDESAVMGRGVWANIDQAIRVYDRLIVVCSRDSLLRGPVLREIERALQKEDQLKKQGAVDTDVLFPIRLDDYVLDEWEHPRRADVVAKDVGDFRDPAKYEKALDRLLHALNPKAWPPKAPGLTLPRAGK